MTTRIDIETWSPEYGTPLPDPFEPSEATVDPTVEVEPDAWRPIPVPPGVEPASRVLFLDGVRRIDALVWLTEGGVTRRGLCASYAAGATRVRQGRATIEGITVRRGLFTTAPPGPLETRAGVYAAMAVADHSLDKLIQSLQEHLGELEIQVAQALGDADDLMVVDGPLSGRQNVPGAVGYVKTHRVAYLPEPLSQVVGRLQPGERTPLFVTTTSWTRYSWYMRLPGPAGHPWAGVVRLEASGDQEAAKVAALAARVTATLPAYASAPHKDPRAPQNLVPIGALERELRRRLGDQEFVYRSLRLTASRARV